MAYYTDETKKTAIKCEGKNAFAWNVETGRFDQPASEVSPKSRMTRCPDFEARRYLFENHPDDLKVCSSMMLFDAVEPNAVFADVLATFYDGKRDELTLEMLKGK